MRLHLFLLEELKCNGNIKTKKNKGLIITTTTESTNRMKTITKVRVLFLDWIAGIFRNLYEMINNENIKEETNDPYQQHQEDKET